MLSDRQLRDYAEGALLPAQASELERLLADVPNSLREIVAQEQIGSALRVAFGDNADEQRIKASILAIMIETPLPPQQIEAPEPVTREKENVASKTPRARPPIRQTIAFAGCVLFVAMALILWFAHQTSYIARVDATGSGTEIIRNGKTFPARAGMLLRKDDTLRAAANATVEFPDATVLNFGPGSSAQIGKSNVGAAAKSVLLLTGSLNAVVRASGERMQLSSASLVASLAKGLLSFAVYDSRTRAELRAGAMRVAHPDNAQPVDVKSGEFVDAAADEEIQPQQIVSATREPARNKAESAEPAMN